MFKNEIPEADLECLSLVWLGGFFRIETPKSLYLYLLMFVLTVVLSYFDNPYYKLLSEYI